MSGREQLQELSAQLQAVEEGIEGLNATIQTIRAQQAAIDEAVEALDTIESGSTVQVPLGGDTYVRATIEDVDDVIVGLGAEFKAEFDREGATDALGERRDRLDERVEEITDRVGDLESQRAQLEQRAQAIQQQALQQQMQGMQGQDDE